MKEVTTPFSEAPRTAFVVPTVAAVRSDAAATAEPGSAAYAADVAEGRAEEQSALATREHVALQARSGDVGPGDMPAELTLSMRQLIIADQWSDKELDELIKKTAKSTSDDKSSPGSFRIGPDLGLEQKFVGSDGEHHWRLVIPATGGP